MIDAQNQFTPLYAYGTVIKLNPHSCQFSKCDRLYTQHDAQQMRETRAIEHATPTKVHASID